MNCPVANYGLIGNTRTAALVSNQGSIDWCCFPHFDSPSLFEALLDYEKGGFFSIRPVGQFQSKQTYLEDTNVLETEFITATGKARICDAFSVTSEANKKKQLWPTHEILRQVEGLSGEVCFEVTYFPRSQYGKNPVQLEDRGQFGIAYNQHDVLFLLRSSLPTSEMKISKRSNSHSMEARFLCLSGKRLYFSLIYADTGPAILPPLGKAADERLEETIRYWRNWISQCRYVGPYNQHVRRSALALKLLTFAPSGAILAAPTTSLPEAVGGIRNWDYRYCWLRDASFTVRALSSLGFHEEAKAFVSWMLHTTRLSRPRLQVLYSVYGHPKLEEKTLNWLSGYRKSRPVRIGNNAHKQFQLDVYGEVLTAISSYAPWASEFDRDTRNFVLDIGRAICKLWNRPDEGIWEIRSTPAHHTHSKMMAWVGLNRLCWIARHYGWKAPIEAYLEVAHKLRTQIETLGYNTQVQSYTRTFGGKDLDASLLLMPLVGYCEATSTRMQNTCQAILKSLSKNGFIYRYRTSEVNDGLPGKEGSFGVCNFWLAANLAKAGQLREAKAWFESLLQRDNPVGLWSEEIDPNTFEFLGNYPQGFTHIGLINAAVTLTEAERERLRAA